MLYIFWWDHPCSLNIDDGQANTKGRSVAIFLLHTAYLVCISRVLFIKNCCSFLTFERDGLLCWKMKTSLYLEDPEWHWKTGICSQRHVLNRYTTFGNITKSQENIYLNVKRLRDVWHSFKLQYKNVNLRKKHKNCSYSTVLYIFWWDHPCSLNIDDGQANTKGRSVAIFLLHTAYLVCISRVLFIKNCCSFLTFERDGLLCWKMKTSFYLEDPEWN